MHREPTCTLLTPAVVLDVYTVYGDNVKLGMDCSTLYL